MGRQLKIEKKQGIREIPKKNIHDSGPLKSFIPADKHFLYDRIFTGRFTDESGAVLGRYAYFEEV